MISNILSPSPYNHIVFCESEEALEQVMSDFEAFLQENQLRLHVKMGKVVPAKRSFDFSFTHVNEEEKKLVLNFLKPNKETAVSRYRVVVNHGYIVRQYPSNDIRFAIILCRSLEQETGVNVIVELYEYAPHAEDDWVLWRDKEGKTANELKLKIIEGEIVITNLVM